MVLFSHGALVSFLPLTGWNKWDASDVHCRTVEVMDMSYLGVFLPVLSYLVLLIIIILYSLVYRTVLKHKKKIHNVTARLDEGVHTFTSDVKTAVSLGVVVVTYVLCFSPYFILVIIMYADKDRADNLYSYYGTQYEVATLMVMTNSGINPIIYAARMTPFRRAFKAILTCKTKETVSLYD